MKTLKTLFPILLFAISITSCNDNDDKSDLTISDPLKYVEGNPILDAYMKASGFDQKAEAEINVAMFEFGFSFKPTVTGKINAVIVKIPDVNPALRVTLWDAETKAVIRSEIVNINRANITVEKVIAPITLTKGKEYFFTVKSDDWITRRKTDNSATTYPITAGNIIITSYAYAPSTAEAFVIPTTTRNDYYAGDATFKFQQTE